MNEYIIIALVAAVALVGYLFFRSKPATHQPIEDAVAPAATRPDAIIIGELENPLVEITPYEGKELQARSFEIPSEVKSSLVPLVQRVPEMLRIGREAATKSLRVVFSKEVTSSLNGGGAKLVEDAAGKLLPVARNVETGKFMEVGRTVAKGGIRMANVAAMGWQIAAIATAQQYLGEINEKLEKIENGLSDVLFLLDQEKRSKLRAYVVLLRQYHDAIKRGQLYTSESDAIFNKLEDLEHDCLTIADISDQFAQRKIQELQNISVEDWFGRSSSAERAKTLIQENAKAMELVFLAHSCRVLGCHVKSALPGDRHLVQDRLNIAKQQVLASSQRFHEAKAQFLERVKGLSKREGNVLALKGMFDTDHLNSLGQEYRVVQEKAEGACKMLEEQSASTAAFSAQFDRMVDSGIAINLRIKDSGEIEILSAGPVAE